MNTEELAQWVAELPEHLGEVSVRLLELQRQINKRTSEQVEALEVLVKLSDCLAANLAENKKYVARIAELEAEVERLTAKAQMDGEIALSESVIDEVIADEKIEKLKAERDEALRNYQFMVNKACDEKLDGYRELGNKCASLEEDRDVAWAEVEQLKKRVESQTDWYQQRFDTLRVWVNNEVKPLSEEVAHRYFSICANGSPAPHESGEWKDTLHGLRLERDGLKAEVERLKEQLSQRYTHVEVAQWLAAYHGKYREKTLVQYVTELREKVAEDERKLVEGTP